MDGGRAAQSSQGDTQESVHGTHSAAGGQQQLEGSSMAALLQSDQPQGPPACTEMVPFA